MANDKILKSWNVNASAWIQTIENNEIQSRQLITNQAIINAIFERQPKKVLDAGCGEGWLVRELHRNGIEAHGFDGVKKLIDQAQLKKEGTFFHLNYDDIRNGQNKELSQYDVIVFNYAIFEKENVDTLFLKLKKHLSPQGVFIIQTISDKNKLFSSRGKDGWMTEDWKTLSTDYPTSFQWYYRSEEEWKSVFALAGLSVVEEKEIIHPLSDEVFSVIYVLRI